MGSTFMAVGLLSCVRADHTPLCAIEQSFLPASGLLDQGLGFITVTVVCTLCQCHGALLVGHSGSSNIRFMSPSSLPSLQGKGSGSLLAERH